MLNPGHFFRVDKKSVEQEEQVEQAHEYRRFLFHIQIMTVEQVEQPHEYRYLRLRAFVKYRITRINKGCSTCSTCGKGWWNRNIRVNIGCSTRSTEKTSEIEKHRIKPTRRKNE